MPCHPLEFEPLRCPSCSVPEGQLHRNSCAIYALPGDKRPIYFKPSEAVKDAMPYTPGERQAIAQIPKPRVETKYADPLNDALEIIGAELAKERRNVTTNATRYNYLMAAIDALTSAQNKS